MTFKKGSHNSLGCFHVGPLLGSNWNLERLAFAEEGKLDNPAKNPLSRARFLCLGESTEEKMFQFFFKCTSLITELFVMNWKTASHWHLSVLSIVYGEDVRATKRIRVCGEF